MNHRRQRWLSRHRSVWITGLLAVFACILVPAGQTAAAQPSREVEISVGYYGAKSYTKTTIRLNELDERLLGSRQIYTWIGETQKCGTTEAEGIYLSDLLDTAEIDMDSVLSYDFSASDPAGPETERHEWKSEELFEGTDGDRYSFYRVFQIAKNAYEDCEDKTDYLNHPEDYFTVRDFFDEQSAHAFRANAWNYRTAVNPMLALKTRSETWNTDAAPPTMFDDSGLQDAAVPLLMTGQNALDDAGTAGSPQAISGIQIWFDGSPKITLTGKNLEGSAGTKGSVSARVSTPDTTLSERIRSEIHFTSSNPSVATVDAKGNVEILKQGKATITALYDSDGDGTDETVGQASVTGTAKTESTGTGGSRAGGDQSQSSEGGTGGSDTGTSSTTGSTGTGNPGGSDSGGNTDGQSVNNSGSSQGVNFSPQRTTVTNTTPRTYSSADAAQPTVGTDTGSNMDGDSDAALEGEFTDDVTEPDGTDTMLASAGGLEANGNIPSGSVVEITPGQSDGSQADGNGGRRAFIPALLGGIIAVICGMLVATGNYWTQTEWVNRAKKIFEKQG